MNKRLLKIVFLFLFFSGNAVAQQWYLSPVYHGRHMYSVAILDRAHIVAAGGNEMNDSLQEIFNSISGGMGWDYSDNQGGGYIRSTTFFDTLNGIAVGYAGKILKTGNGATSWTRVYPPGVMNQRNFNKVVYLNAQTLFAFGGRNYGNDTIQTIIKSTDGGASWSVILDQAGRWLKSAYFTDSNTGFAVGENGTIIKTTNGGANWSPVTSPIYTRTFNSITFTDADIGYIVGGVRYDTPDSTRTILKTIDGGDSWTIFMDESGGWLTDISFTDMNSGYIVGDANTFYKTTDGGQSWLPQTVDGAQDYSSFNSVRFLNDDFGVIAGMYGEVYLYSNEPLPEIHAALPSIIDGTVSATLRADIDCHGSPVSYNFKYSTDPGFTSSLFAFSILGPQFFNSNTLSTAEGVVNNLQPDVTYYFYATATSASGTVVSDTLSFVTTLPNTYFSTYPATSVFPGSAQLNGIIQGAVMPVTLSFEYGTTPQLGNEVAANPSTVNTPGSINISASLASLSPGTVYYYRLKGIAPSVVCYGSIVSFQTGFLNQTQTKPAANVTSTSARLWGAVSNNQGPSTIWFEYNATGGDTVTVAAIPPSVNDALYHNVYADISGLLPDTSYQFRVKVVDNVHTTYANYLQVHTGVNPIPNFDFEDWTQVSGEKPTGWYNIFGPVVKVSPGYSGNYAVKLEHTQSANGAMLNGVLDASTNGEGMPRFLRGAPFNSRPDTLSGMFKYDFAPGDSGFVVILFKSQGEIICQQFLSFGGSSPANFTELKFPVEYTSPATPDTVIIGLMASFGDHSTVGIGDWMIVDDLKFIGNHPDIPNYGFEDWTSFTFNNLDQWKFTSMLDFGIYDDPSYESVNQSGDAQHGTSSAELNNQQLYGAWIAGELKGPNSPGQHQQFFSIQHRPLALNGYYKFYPINNDTLRLQFDVMSHGLQVATGIVLVTDSADEFTPFNIPVTYSDTLNYPDSAHIEIRTSSIFVQGTSHAIIDNLRMDGFTDNITVSAPVVSGRPVLSIYPNPGKDQLTVMAGNLSSRQVAVEIYDNTGNEVYRKDNIGVSERFTIFEMNTSSLNPGLYIVRLTDGNRYQSLRWIKL